MVGQNTEVTSVPGCVHDVNVFTDARFISFRETLDSEMKRLKGTGKYQRKKAAVIGVDDEDILWEKGLLGDHNPKVLLDTMVYYIGLYFAIRGGEHRKLRHYPSQLRLIKPERGSPYLVFTEDVSKSNQGGLLHRKKAETSSEYLTGLEQVGQ